jgi:integrase/recombinase XerD
LFLREKAPYTRLGDRGIEKAITKIATQAKFDKSVFPHLFRHSFATHNLNRGMNLSTLQHLMGHENSSTTMIYAELSEENIRHEYKKLA